MDIGNFFALREGRCSVERKLTLRQEHLSKKSIIRHLPQVNKVEMSI